MTRFNDRFAAKAWHDSADYRSTIDRRLDNSFGIMTPSQSGARFDLEKPPDTVGT